MQLCWIKDNNKIDHLLVEVYLQVRLAGRQNYDNPDYQKEIAGLKKELVTLRKKYDDTDKDYPEMIGLLKKEDLY